ncbi:hypothetical protein [Sporosarcina sp. P18a]|uniref:hypothetical protein n=1 Tax=Sporosarcina sp. P18a TaxID=2048259 RepID=UPI00118194BB|nr:hypothetical protein [Sporosarcina sp. P18a]
MRSLYIGGNEERVCFDRFQVIDALVQVGNNANQLANLVFKALDILFLRDYRCAVHVGFILSMSEYVFRQPAKWKWSPTKTGDG